MYASSDVNIVYDDVLTGDEKVVGSSPSWELRHFYE